MDSQILATLIEQATSPSLSKADMVLNKKVCQKLNDDESLYVFTPIPYRAGAAVAAMKARLVKKNPAIQCLTLDLVECAVRSCGNTFHTKVGSEEFMNTLVRLLKVAELSPVVFLNFEV